MQHYNKSQGKSPIIRLATIGAYLDDKLPTRDFLVTWGVWSRQVDRLGVRSYASLYCITTVTSQKTVALNPDELDMVDGVMCQMRQTSNAAFELLYNRFVRALPIAKIAKSYHRRCAAMAKEIGRAEHQFHNSLVLTYAEAAELPEAWAQDRLLTLLET